jgi:FMN reductase
MTSALKMTVIVGNPKRESRTTAVGVAVAGVIAAHAGPPHRPAAVIELADLSGGLFSWGDPSVAEAKSAVLSSDVLVVASPVFKASHTGLLKAFLDHFGQGELAALATVPVMVGASAAHSLAVECQLRPVLIEIGASCPTRGIYVVDSELDSLAATLAAWTAQWGDVLLAVAAGGSRGASCPRSPLGSDG